MKEIPLLTASDVELRVAQIQQTNYGPYVSLICYKDARCDMKMLDSVFGPMNWKRSHEILDGKLFCTVSVWDDCKEQWITKQDVGVESNTEATKGQASDAFKRACFNIGIGRELYNAPDIRFKLADNEVVAGANGKPKTYAKFHIGSMVYDKDQQTFVEFTVLDENGNTRFDINSNRSPARNSNPQKTNTPVNHMDTGETINTPGNDDGQLRCSECNTVIKSAKVAEYSMNKFGRLLCYKCQKTSVE